MKITNNFKWTMYGVVIVALFLGSVGFSYQDYLDKFFMAPKTSDYRDVNDEAAILIQYVGSEAWGQVVSTRTNVNDCWTFYDGADVDTSVGEGGIIWSSMTTYDTMAEWVAELDADTNWVCKLVDARAGEDSKLLANAGIEKNGSAMTVVSKLLYSTMTCVFVDANGNATTYANAFGVAFDTGTMIGVPEQDNEIHWGQTPTSGKRIVITYISANIDIATTGKLDIYFGDVLRMSVPLANNTSKTLFTNDDESLWAPIDTRVTIVANGDETQSTAGGHLMVNWYQQ